MILIKHFIVYRCNRGNCRNFSHGKDRGAWEKIEQKANRTSRNKMLKLKLNPLATSPLLSKLIQFSCEYLYFNSNSRIFFFFKCLEINIVCNY